MMKKKLFVLFLSVLIVQGLLPTAAHAAVSTKAIYSCGFEATEDLSGWSFLDADGDGQTFLTDRGSVWNFSANTGTEMLASASWDNGTSEPLTPDNYAISPAVKISDQAAGDLTLSWYVRPQDVEYGNEKYSVYIYDGTEALTVENAGTLLQGKDVFTETLDGLTGYELRGATLSGYAGKTIQIVFRHYDCTDQFWLDIDDIALSGPVTHVAAKASTCTEQGSDEYWCDAGGTLYGDENCTEVLEGIPYLPLAAHTLTAVPAKASTCIEQGSSAYWTCSVCGQIFGDEAGTQVLEGIPYLPLADHTYGDWTVVKEATESSEGTLQRVCSVCGNTETKTYAYVGQQTSNKAPQQTQQHAASVQTGDSSSTLLWIFLGMAAAGMMYFMKRKRA